MRFAVFAQKDTGPFPDGLLVREKYQVFGIGEKL